MPAIKSTGSNPKGPLFQIDNILDGETVHQRSLLMRGRVDGNTLEGNISVSVQDPAGCSAFPQQFTALEQGLFKVLVLLSPGENKFTFRLVTADGTGDGAHVLNITYIPLLQNPPLHLAIMIAKDSPLLIDCPPAKGGSISSAHSSLDAAIAKFRMSAYQWQALTAEDMWTKGLGRRSFRLEEEWAADTTSREFVHSLHDAALYQSGAMRSTAKIHLVRSSKTVAEICDDQLAQQNQSAHSKDKISDYFLEALKTYGGPFESSARPIVAGMILDSHYSLSQDLILGHAALGCHNPNGISLGMFGSHLTYSWPRFLEEVSFCLRDTRSPGDTVGNDCGECHTMWEACSIGQGAFLHEVGHAFGAPHTTGIMARGYAQDWPKSFLARTAYCAHTNKEGFVVIDGETENEARWDIRDALSFRMLPHFRLPGDKQFQEYIKSAAPTVKANMEGHGEWTLCVSSAYDIARVQFNDKTEPFPSVTQPEQMASYTKKSLEARFDTTEPLRLHVLGLNGKEKVVRNVWRLFRQLSQTQIRIPGSELVLHKRSVTSIDLEEGNNDNKFWEWATLLEHRTESGDIKYATKVEVCTGCILDGAYVHLNGSRINCGPWRNKWGGKKNFGGHATEALDIPKGQNIRMVEVSRADHILHGLRMHLSNGVAKGALSGDPDQTPPETIVLEPAASERIVGFYGRSYFGEMCDGLVEFGIITAPKDAVLPPAVFSMEELQNTDGGADIVDLSKGNDNGVNEYLSQLRIQEGLRPQRKISM